MELQRVSFVKGILQKISPLRENQAIKGFFNHLGIVFVFRFTSAVLNLIAMVLAARALGVVALGDITTIQNAAYFLIIPMILGVNTSIIKYLPEREREDGDELVFSALVWNLILTVFFILFYMGLHGFFLKITHQSFAKWSLSVFLAVAMNFSMVLESVLRARKQFLTLGILKMASASLFFIVVCLTISRPGNFYYFMVGFIASYGMTALCALKAVKIKKTKLTLKAFKLIYGYGAINMVSWVLSTTLFSSDLFIVNHFCSGYDVGIYSVYQVNVRNFFNIMFHEIFAVVFLSTIVQMDKMKIYQRIIRLIPLLLAVAILANAALCAMILLMYGRGYPFNWVYMAMVSLGTGLHFIYWMFNSVFTVEGKKGALLCLSALGIPLPLLLAANILLTKTFGIMGTMASWLMTQVVLIGMFLFIIKHKYVKKCEVTE